MKPTQKSFRRSLLTVVIIVAAIVIYAYGFQVTQVNLEETAKPQRQQQLVRIIRALAQPDLLTYQQEVTKAQAPVLIPCPATLPTVPAAGDGPSLTLSKPCANGGEQITIVGSGFPANADVAVRFRPESLATLPGISIRTDAKGAFSTTFTLPRNREAAVAQNMEAEYKRNIGRPAFSDTSRETWNKIIETIFMALLATTLGMVLAFPIGFLAANNLMRSITSPFTAIMLSLLTLPIGLLAGSLLGGQFGRWGISLGGGNVLLGVGALAALGAVMLIALRVGVGGEEDSLPTRPQRVGRVAGLMIAGLTLFINLGLISILSQSLGAYLSTRVGSLGFLGLFLANVAHVLELLLPLIGAAAGMALVSALTRPLGAKVLPSLAYAPRRAIAVALAALNGALYASLIGAALGWLYRLENPTNYLVLPAVAGAVVGLIIGLRADVETPTPIGQVVYFITRTVLNALRAIEPLIMVIVFAVWVGIGPFAGVLALCLHTIASLGKLYSEQVESIQSGPLEAITATGATRLQTIVYAVIPQVVPPFISFTLYRWDINVRMSTIIGFAGGGGIGFLLQQNINLLQYRQASVQMLAIALVVASLDYLSAAIREHYV
ncbi:MAG: ABC transporter permease subunit [Anaerolineae bacterium]